MAVTADAVNEKVEAAISAIETADYATAETKLLAAQALLSVIPDTNKASLGIRYDRTAIAGLLDRVRTLRRAYATPGIRRTKITYARAEDDA